MNERALRSADKRLESYLARMTACMSRKEQKRWAGYYLRGLLLDGQRKSIEPLAARVGGNVQSLQQFIGQSTWSAEEVQRTLNDFMQATLNRGVYWIVDETSFPKQGNQSVGVARQYCGALGKTANCQVAVSLHWSKDQMNWPMGWRLFLPESWIGDKERRRRAGIPEEVEYRPKTDLAMELIQGTLSHGMAPGVVLADHAYGSSFGWRRQLRDLGLAYCVNVSGDTGLWLDSVWQNGREHSGVGRPRKFPSREQIINPQTLARQLPGSAWRKVSWREGSKGPQRSRFAMAAVWVSSNRQSEGSSRERWREYLLIEWPRAEAAPTKYWLSWWLDEKPELLQVVRAAKGRWPIEQDYREMKEELGLDHFEGRSWQGWHHHVAMVTLAFAFLRLEQRRFKKKDR